MQAASSQGAGGNLGVLLVDKGYTTPERIQECLRVQGEFLKQNRPSPRLGELLVAKGFVTAEQVTEALAAQKQEIRSCTQCGIQVNVPVRADAVDYRCGCGGELKERKTAGRIAVSDAPIMILTDEPLPDEVEEARQDPQRMFGKYVLLRELGRGGVGVVDLAWDTFLSQYVALKRVRADAMEEVPGNKMNWQLESLLKEARHAIKLRHPSIVTVFEAGCIDSQIYVSMEFLEGRTLEQEMTLSRALGHATPFYAAPRQVLGQLAEAARALHYAHSRPAPIIHCDLKPGNLLIDREGRIHVLDFGLARNLRAQRGGPEEISGTPEYMAPEQVRAETGKMGPRTDVYGFGAVLYEVLSGSPPFEGQPISILEQVVCVSPRPPGDLAAGQKGADPRLIPPAIEALCMSCLEKDPARRPATMEAVSEILERERLK